jgi:hypothetical protein
MKTWPGRTDPIQPGTAPGGTNAGQLPESLRFVAAFTPAGWLVVTLIVLARGGSTTPGSG